MDSDITAELETTDRDTLVINTIRTLSMDAVQKANSGHPGTPMAMAPVVYTLWQKFLRFDPADPTWPNRDRFVLSAGHASMLLYSMLHLTGTVTVKNKYNEAGKPAVSLDDIEHFRQLDSHTPGHPEYHMTSGIETTTGPLGQGVANSVGMAIAQKYLAAHYNKPDMPIFDYRIWSLCGDGDMMEGVSSEAASIAGHLRLDNLCWIYDSNHITIEGRTDLAFSEDVGLRFEAYGWDVHRLTDANDTKSLADVLAKVAKGGTGRPTFIVINSIIGWGAPKKQDTSAAHGEPLGEDQIKAAKKFYGWPEDAHFLVPKGVYDIFHQGIGKRGHGLNAEWQSLMDRYRQKYPKQAAEVELIESRELPKGWDKDIPTFDTDEKGIATRKSSQQVLNAVAENFPWLIGGAADLSPSTNTNLTFAGSGSFSAGNYGGRNMHFGIREHAMGSIVNGMTLTKIRAYGSGFLIFSDYMKPPIRLASIMEIPSIFIFTHDSIGVGEDGPTHQPIEQLIALRSIPGIIVIRPADANEVAEAWRTLIPMQEQPVCLILSRQNLPTIDRSKYGAASGLAQGAYVVADPKEGAPEVILIGTGSEVQHCIAAFETLSSEGIKARVVSMPSWELFERQEQSYKDKILPPAIKARVTIEQGAIYGWERYAGGDGTIIGMHSFGASAPLKDLLKKFGFSPDKVAEAAREQVKKNKK
jgi:transketolase